MIKPLVVMIVGPTAAGKTEVAIGVASQLQGEIISADSRLFYRGMDIGTAKPDVAERAGIPHHLIDIVKPDEVFTISDYQVAVQRLVTEIRSRGKLPIITGGTGQYVRSLLHGWEIPSAAPDPALREAIMSWGQAVGAKNLHQKLALVDPGAAGIIEYQNVRRTIRAWEVIFQTGKRFSDLRTKRDGDYDVIQIGITRPREALYQRIDQRIEQMLDAGLVAEVSDLLAKGYGTELPSMSAIGYREVAAFLQGEITLNEAVTLMKRYTRTYVRRQANWFKSDDPVIRWFDYRPGLADEVSLYIKGQIKLKTRA